ncbi:MAG: hypothetical protein APZ16_06955 [Candidatus Hadarchaeum yellowstonense]|jgi:hypothetical protein|uniref:Uncharacterized protein n=1 Tax=Hadarchaeum yellowstonense TaxID=1776334 RepID=A0A147JU18_HADYE|nr:MAG: hypothetical protein APZ16_06955 [Candidatus Hadarchaeum yellowstonense]
MVSRRDVIEGRCDMTELINEGIKRRLRVSLFIIEKDLRQIKDALKGGHPEEAIFYRYVDNVNPASKPRIMAVIADMLNEIKEMREIFELETEEIELRAKILAALNEIWVILEELRPEKLKGYGRLPGSDKALIEPHVMSLLNKLEELHRLL